MSSVQNLNTEPVTFMIIAGNSHRFILYGFMQFLNKFNNNKKT